MFWPPEVVQRAKTRIRYVAFSFLPLLDDDVLIPLLLPAPSNAQHGSDDALGVALSDRYTLEILNYMERINKTSATTMQDLFDSYDPIAIHSTPGVRTDLFRRPLDSVRITDFFGGVAQVELTHSSDQLKSSGIDFTF
jgi:glycosylphosphatidylinositol transamidase (GPIT) subunit GPI8